MEDGARAMLALPGRPPAAFASAAHRLADAPASTPRRTPACSACRRAGPRPAVLDERVDHAHADAVQAARDLVATAAELAAGVQHGVHDLERVLAGGVLADRDAAAVVDHLGLPSAWMVTSMRVATLAIASSMLLSTTSKMSWCRPRSSVDPMYMPGRLRTAVRPSRTWMLAAVYSVEASRARRLDGASSGAGLVAGSSAALVPGHRNRGRDGAGGRHAAGDDGVDAIQLLVAVEVDHHAATLARCARSRPWWPARRAAALPGRPDPR